MNTEFINNLKKDNFSKIRNVHSQLIFGEYMNNPYFTVCIPIYGIGKYLYDTLYCLKKLKNENGKCIQFIISNNSASKSDDKKIAEIIEALGLMNVVYFNTDKSLGQLNNFNRCAELCRTAYFTILHDDDLLVDDYIEYVENALPVMKSNNIGMIHERYTTFRDSIPLHTNSIAPVVLHEITDDIITAVGAPWTGIPSCGVIYNANAFLQSGGFNDEYPFFGDNFLALAMKQRGFFVFQTSKIVGYYRLSVNYSIRFEVCLGLIKEADRFRKDWYTGRTFNKLYYLLMHRFFYSKDIDFRVKWFSDLNPKITEKTLDYKDKYKKYRDGNVFEIISQHFFNKALKKAAKIKL